MRLLLDTHVLLWALSTPLRIPAPMRDAIACNENDVLFSAASIWEIAIKVRIGRLKLSMAIEELQRAAADTNFQELPVRSVHAAATARLPAHHTDPFDRLLVAQAMREPARLLTADRRLKAYSDLVQVIV
jgi:PIN domain nuclease of toxin-antitoxin system